MSQFFLRVKQLKIGCRIVANLKNFFIGFVIFQVLSMNIFCIILIQSSESHRFMRKTVSSYQLL